MVAFLKRGPGAIAAAEGLDSLLEEGGEEGRRLLELREKSLAAKVSEKPKAAKADGEGLDPETSAKLRVWTGLHGEDRARQMLKLPPMTPEGKAARRGSQIREGFKRAMILSMPGYSEEEREAAYVEQTLLLEKQRAAAAKARKRGAELRGG